jgi:hypothetical protein
MASTLPPPLESESLSATAPVRPLAPAVAPGEEVSFLSLVANQVALAVDDSLNFDASQQAKEALRASEERLRLIVDNIPGLVGVSC